MLKLKKTLILASQSPRRRELLTLMGMDFEVDVPNIFEEFTSKQFADPQTLVRANAEGKVNEIKQRHPSSLILGVDTVVDIQGQVLGKPANQEEAFQMLKTLQGQTHLVWTGVQVLDAETGEKHTFEEKTEVDFSPMSDEEIKNYIQTKEPMDKAGAYAIQGLGSVYIKGIRGDFFNVVGLPIHRLHDVLKEMV